MSTVNSHVGIVSYLTTLFLGKPPGGNLPVKGTVLLPVTDNLLFLNQQRREIIFPRKNVPDTRIDHWTRTISVNVWIGKHF